MGEPERRGVQRQDSPRAAAASVGRVGRDSRDSRDAQLRQSADVLDAMGDAVVAINPRGVIVHWSEAAQQLFGWPAARFVGQPVAEALLELQAAPGLCGRAEERLAADGSWEGELELVARDGTRIALDVKAKRLQRAPPEDDDAPEAIGILARALDVRPRQEVLRRLREEENRYRSFVEHNADPIFGIDPDGILTEANPAAERVSGYSQDELVGSSFIPLLMSDEVESVMERFISALAGHTQRFETAIRAKDGERLPLGITAVPIFAGGEVTGIFGIARDLREAKEVEARRAARQEDLKEQIRQRTRALEAANEELQAFSYSVSHDLRAPLRGIDFYAQVLEEDHAAKLDGEARDVVARIRRESQRMSQLIRDLLQLGQAAREPLGRQDVDLSQLAGSIVEGLRQAQPARTIDVEIEEGLHAHADPRMLRVVLENLIGNAWKYTGNREQARIRVGCDPEHKAFFVEDNGIGFDKGAARKLFQPFKRLPNAAAFEGTGVGLATVERIVRRHGGSVSAEGRPGAGATFRFTLPEDSSCGNGDAPDA